jgi:hypothetical protein
VPTKEVGTSLKNAGAAAAAAATAEVAPPDEKAAARNEQVTEQQMLQECNICGCSREGKDKLVDWDDRDKLGLLKYKVQLADKMENRAVTVIPHDANFIDDANSIMTACDEGFLYQWKDHPARDDSSVFDDSATDVLQDGSYCNPGNDGSSVRKLQVFKLQQVFQSGKKAFAFSVF